MKDLFREQSQIVWIHVAEEAIDDPYEKNVTHTEVMSLPIKAIITDLTATQINYKMIGILTANAKEIIIESKWKELIKQSYTIEVNDIQYIGWRQEGKLQYRIEQGYLRLYIYSK